MTPPAATRSTPRATSSARRQEILDTATEVFADKGLLATTVRDISERAGILSGSLYHHFASKEEMIADILGPVITSQVEAFDRILALELKDSADILRRWIAVAINQTASNPRVARILRQDEHHIRDLAGLDEVVRQRREMRDRMESVIEAGMAAGRFRADTDPRAAALAIFDYVLGAYRLLKPVGRMEPEEATHQLTSLLLLGLEAK